MYEDFITPERKREMAMQRVGRIAEDAYANFLVGRGFEAQGENAMAAKHFAAVDSLDLALHAVLAEAQKHEAPPQAEEVDHGHEHR